MTRPIVGGATAQSTIVRILDVETGLPATGITAGTAGLSLWYRRDAATVSTVAAVALGSLDEAHTSGGWRHIADGYYRLDLPNAACALGAPGLLVGGAVPGGVVIGQYHALVSASTDALSTVLERIGTPTPSGSTLFDWQNADAYIDTSVSPWQFVLIQAGTGGLGTGTELLRQNLFDTTGDDITTATQVVGRRVTA